MKPTAEIPAFKEQLPFINGKVRINSVFAFAFEKDGLKILAEENVMVTKAFDWGEDLPSIDKISLSKKRVSPGDEITINFSGDKGYNNDAVFFLVNNHLIGGGSLGNYLSLNDESHSLRVPPEYSKGDNFEIKVMAFAGRIDLNNPTNASLKGIKIISYSIPVR